MRRAARWAVLLLAAGPAAGQPAPPDLAACAPLRGDAAAYGRCVHAAMTDHTRQLRTDSGQPAAPDEATLRRCGDYLTAQRAAGRTVPTATRDNACQVARQMGMPGG